jgi:hypothetical protein
MANNLNYPKEYDAVMGGTNPPPIYGAVLGGIDGIKKRLASSVVEVQIAALSDAINYGDIGLDSSCKLCKMNQCRCNWLPTLCLRIDRNQG